MRTELSSLTSQILDLYEVGALTNIELQVRLLALLESNEVADVFRCLTDAQKRTFIRWFDNTYYQVDSLRDMLDISGEGTASPSLKSIRKMREWLAKAESSDLSHD